jgi:hypothetical protein
VWNARSIIPSACRIRICLVFFNSTQHKSSVPVMARGLDVFWPSRIWTSRLEVVTSFDVNLSISAEAMIRRTPILYRELKRKWIICFASIRIWRRIRRSAQRVASRRGCPRHEPSSYASTRAHTACIGTENTIIVLFLAMLHRKA